MIGLFTRRRAKLEAQEADAQYEAELRAIIARTLQAWDEERGGRLRRRRQGAARAFQRARRARRSSWTPIGRPGRVWGPKGKRMKSTLSRNERNAIEGLRVFRALL